MKRNKATTVYKFIINGKGPIEYDFYYILINTIFISVYIKITVVSSLYFLELSKWERIFNNKQYG